MIENDGELNIIISFEKIVEPKNVKEVFGGPFQEKCMKAMENKMNSMGKNGVWTLVDIPRGRKAI